MKEYNYIAPQNLKDIADELIKMNEHQEYSKLQELIEHINLYVQQGLDIFDSAEVYEMVAKSM